MKKRIGRPTSKQGEFFIGPHKVNHKEKIKAALQRLRIGGTHEDIANASSMRPDQVWKRLSEMERENVIFATGLTRKLKSGVNGIVWQLIENTIPK